MNKYPEHEKLSAVQEKSQAIREFLEWLDFEKNYTICSLGEAGGDLREEYSPVYTSTEKLLAEFFNIDQIKLEKDND